MEKFKYKWNARFAKNTGTYYAQATIYLGKVNGKFTNTTMHLNTYIMDCPDGMECDHISHDTLDNRKSNLRLSYISQNTKHRKGANKNNTSGYRNVSWDKRTKDWIVQIQVEGRNKILGRFKDVDEAGEYAQKMRNKYYGDFAGEG